MNNNKLKFFDDKPEKPEISIRCRDTIIASSNLYEWKTDYDNKAKDKWILIYKKGSKICKKGEIKTIKEVSINRILHHLNPSKHFFTEEQKKLLKGKDRAGKGWGEYFSLGNWEVIEKSKTKIEGYRLIERYGLNPMATSFSRGIIIKLLNYLEKNGK